MYVGSNKGTKYGFCPAKATWGDPEALYLFELLCIVAETGQLLVAGGIADQPGWLIDELGWFLPRYSMLKFAQQAQMVLGSDSSKKAPTPQPVQPMGEKQRTGIRA